MMPYYGFNQWKDEPYTDPWGCMWQTTDNGVMGTVHKHPLKDWAGFDRYRAPDPNATD